MFKIKVADKEAETTLEPALTQEEALYWYQVIMERVLGVSIDLEEENELICPECKSDNVQLTKPGLHCCENCYEIW